MNKVVIHMTGKKTNFKLSIAMNHYKKNRFQDNRSNNRPHNNINTSYVAVKTSLDCDYSKHENGASNNYVYLIRNGN